MRDNYNCFWLIGLFKVTRARIILQNICMPDTKHVKTENIRDICCNAIISEGSYLSSSKHCLYDLHDDSNCIFSLNVNYLS